MNNETPTGQRIQDLLAWSERLDVLGDIIQTIASHDEQKLALFTETLGGIVSDYSRAINETADTINTDLEKADDKDSCFSDVGTDSKTYDKLKKALSEALEGAGNLKKKSKKGRSVIIKLRDT